MPINMEVLITFVIGLEILYLIDLLLEHSFAIKLGVVDPTNKDYEKMRDEKNQ